MSGDPKHSPQRLGGNPTLFLILSVPNKIDDERRRALLALLCGNEIEETKTMPPRRIQAMHECFERVRREKEPHASNLLISILNEPPPIYNADGSVSWRPRR